jgi:HSP20 family molecular chaperone IbpA
MNTLELVYHITADMFVKYSKDGISMHFYLYYCRERHYGSFQRSFRLPAGVESDKVDANFKNGVLTIGIPKSEESKQKKIEIKST